MNITKEEFEKLLYKQVGFYKDSGREESSNFLLWFLMNYYRLDEDEAIEYICDRRNDKGIDGIFVDNNTQEIFLFQGKFYKSFCKNQGDSDLNRFVGVKEWFKQENVGKLSNSNANRELKSLVSRLEVFDCIDQDYRLNLVFVTTGYFDRNAKDYIEITKNIVEYWDCDLLHRNYTYSGKDEFVRAEYTFKVNGDIIKYGLEDDIPTYIFSSKASNIIELDGIVDRSLFAKNVRFGLGLTRVNKDIKKTIGDGNEHKNFLLYNNGITIIAEKLEYNKNKKELKMKNYSIVNGCQTTLTLYENRNSISDDLMLILKIIETGENPRLGKNITYYTNNQNPISIVDLWSQDKFQQDLKENFKDSFNDKVFYKIKPGEETGDYEEVIENTFAAQLIYSFNLEKPYEAHLKTKIFSSYHSDIFNRKIDEYLIYFLYKLYKIIENNVIGIEEPIIRSYKLTRFFLLNLIKKVMEDDDIGKRFFQSPKDFYNNYYDKIESSFTKLAQFLMIELNSLIKDEKDNVNGYIDYKNLLRNTEEVKRITNLILNAYKKSLVRHPEDKIQSLLGE